LQPPFLYPSSLKPFIDRNLFKRIAIINNGCYFVLSISNQLFSQQADSLSNELTINLEVRPRAEYTYNYAIPPNDTVSPFLYISQRNRLSISYARQKWLIKSDFQEIHYWDKFHSTSKVGGLNFYQLFLETKFKGVNIRAGRQGVLLDNGRIFF